MKRILPLFVILVPLLLREVCPLPPVVFIPGNGGCQLEGRLENAQYQQEGCERHRDWFRLWMNVWELRPGNLHCRLDNFRLLWDPNTRKSRNNVGVFTRVPGWGNTSSIEFIDDSYLAWVLSDIGNYGSTLIKEMVKWGYKRGESVRGAPYDWRYSPKSSTSFMRNLKKLVEDTYYANGKKKVVLMTHSQGGQFSLYFLNKQPQHWKAKFIQSLISLGTPWQGTMIGVLAIASGYSWNHYQILDNLKVREPQRSYETTAMLLPTPQLWKDKPLVITPDYVYTANDYQKFFNDIGFSTGMELHKEVLSEDFAFKHPGVPMYCLYGTGIHTMETLLFREGEFPDVRPQILYGDGDGTINAASAAACSVLGTEGPVWHQAFHGIEHNQLLKSKQVSKVIKRLLSGNEQI